MNLAKLCLAFSSLNNLLIIFGFTELHRLRLLPIVSSSPLLVLTEVRRDWTPRRTSSDLQSTGYEIPHALSGYYAQ